MIFKKPELKLVFKDPPIAALRQPQNLKKMLCRATLYQPKRENRYQRNCLQSAPWWKKCGKGSTTCCPFTLPPTKTVTGLVTGFTHNMMQLPAKHPTASTIGNASRTTVNHFQNVNMLG